ncbi:MAG: SDR family oxidoreductase [Gaiellaceae bacterium]
MAGPSGREILLTGATGFVGKVALEALLRRREELAIDRVHLLIRSTAARSARERFEAEIETSSCFVRLPPGWSEHVDVVEGDVASAGCGLPEEPRRLLAARLTHVLHLAASIDFELPLTEALMVNTDGALSLLELAREAPSLERLVVVSTAYVTPHPGDGVVVRETLSPLPRPAADIRREILAGGADEATLLRETRHPNAYTLTKCLGEHLLVERRGKVPLCIVRPSIVCASWRDPFPGWIDSAAAFAGLVVAGGTGYLRAVAAYPDTRLDLVPVDVVVEHVLRAAFAPSHPGDDGVRIDHAVAGVAHSPTVADCRDHVIDFFRRHQVDLWPHVPHILPVGPRFAVVDAVHHVARIQLGALARGRGWRAGARARSRLRRLNRAFAYFTHHTFDFATDPGPRPEPHAYLDTICSGVHRHLLRQDDTEIRLAGRRGPRHSSDLRFVLRQPEGSFAIRLTAWLVTKALRRASDLVTFDLASFERARLTTPRDARLVLAPSHRSYLDFVLSAYLCFARPDLGIAVPHNAAAVEFSRIPVMGRFFRSLNAFYVERGQGREDENLTSHVHALARDGKTIEFFIEGTRSRSRRFLDPKRGFVRALQTSGERIVVLPIAISYDRVPEETSFLHELAGNERAPMRLSALVGWTGRLLRGRVRLGRIHLAAGAPVLLDKSRSAADIGRQVVAELQRATTLTTFHLRALLVDDPALAVDVPALADAVRARGGCVLESSLDVPEAADPSLRASLRHQVEHLAYPEARLALGQNPIVTHHLARNDFVRSPPAAEALADPYGHLLLRAVLGPVFRDYVRVAERLGSGATVESPRAFVRSEPDCVLSNVEAAFDDLARRGVLERDGSSWSWGPRAADLSRCRELYASAHVELDRLAESAERPNLAVV